MTFHVPRRHVFKNWKSEFLHQKENSWLCDIPNEYIQDAFNLTGLDKIITHFNLCCDVIIGKRQITEISSAISEDVNNQLPRAYGLIHARYIMSPDGLKSVEKYYQEGRYGTCPRVYCRDENVVPIGLSSTPNKSTVKVFCPCCRQIFSQYQCTLDGAYFGPNMCQIFIDQEGLVNRKKNYEPYIRKAFGFKVRECNDEEEYSSD